MKVRAGTNFSSSTATLRYDTRNKSNTSPHLETEQWRSGDTGDEFQQPSFLIFVKSCEERPEHLNCGMSGGISAWNIKNKATEDFQINEHINNKYNPGAVAYHGVSSLP